MRWTPGGTSDDIEDRRDEDDGGGGGGGFGFGGMHIGLGGVVVLFILSLVFKQNFFALLGGGTTAPVATTVHRPNPARDECGKAAGTVRFLRARRYAENMGAGVAATGGSSLSPCEAGAVSQSPRNPGAAEPNRPRDLSIVRPMNGCTSTWGSMMS